MKTLRFIGLLLALAATLAGCSAAHADLIKQSTSYNKVILMVTTADVNVGATGLSLTIQASKAGGALTTITPTVTELGSGLYSIALTSSHTGTLGALVLHVTGSGAVPSDSLDQVVAFDPTDPAALGLTRLDAAMTSRATPAQILSNTSNLLATDGSGRVTVGTNADKTGYALSQAFPTNFSLLAISGGGAVTAGTVSGNVTIGGYAAGQDPATLVWGASPSGFLTSGTMGWQLNVATANVDGVFTYNPSTHVLTLKNKANTTTMATLTLTKDSSGNTTARASN